MKRRIEIVEAARGAAALYVMVGHVFWTAFEVTGSGGPLFRLFRYGHEAVILFFLLSGFSIHYSYCQRPLGQSPELKKYFIGRLRRIYPIFLIAFAATIALGALAVRLSPETLSRRYETGLSDFIAQFLFLTDLNIKGAWFLVPPGNAAFWSLSYEVAFYLVYPLFWKVSQRFPSSVLIGFAVALGLANEALIHTGLANHLSNVFGYYWMWCAGAVAAQLLRAQIRPTIHTGLFVLGLATTLLLASIFDSFPWRRFNDWLWALLFALFFFGYIARFTPAPKALSITLVTALVLAAVALADFMNVPGSPLFLFAKFVAAWALCLFLTTRPAERLRLLARPILQFKRAASYSYALYAVHLPLILFSVDLLLLFQLHPLWAILSLPPILCLARWIESTLTPTVQRPRGGHLALLPLQ